MAGPLRVGLVGVGQRGLQHVQALTNLQTDEIVQIDGVGNEISSFLAGETWISAVDVIPAAPVSPQLFIRGDANGDGTFAGLTDGLFILTAQFVAGSPQPPCL